MKKLILLAILVLGFIYEGKAQFAPSSEVYAYIPVDKPLDIDAGISLYYVVFGNGKFDDMFCYVNDETDIVKDMQTYERKAIGKSVHWVDIFDPETSTSKYYAYKWGGDRSHYKTYVSYTFFSKDKKIMIKKAGNSEPSYYKNITISELEALFKPNFDFLE